MIYHCVTLLICTGFMKTMSVAEKFKVTGPVLPLIINQGEDVVLPCSLRPNISAVDMRVEWSKLGVRSLIVHLYKDRAEKNDEQFEDYRGRTSLFKEELKNGNTSLKLSAVQISDEGVYNCLIESSSDYDDINVYVKIKGQVFHAWKIIVFCISLFSCGLLVFAAFILKEKELSPAQCSAVAYMHRHSENVRKEWDLKKYNTSVEGYKRLIPAVTNCTKIRLASFHFTEQLIITLSEALQSENSSVQELDLSYNYLQGIRLGKLSAGLKRVETLSLTMCKLSEEFFDTLQSALQSQNSCLKELDLSYNDLQDSGMEKLCGGLTSPRCKLETLRLAGCVLTDQLIITLSEAVLSENSSLKELDLSYNDLQGLRLENLSNALNRLEVVIGT
ncbi:NACHT, LRR and PYD domains-containing protein 12-like [Hoplias malabaricus]|uniref:NACHT, LRR and PYD domains-containing protein 12-like n=1 Tax=Hoplias malabaricus TaxID=27720 RepID=UPI003462E7DB